MLLIPRLRTTGSHEVRGSNPLRSTLESKRKAAIRRPFLFWGVLLATACHARYSIAGNCGGRERRRFEYRKPVHRGAIGSYFKVSIDIGGHTDRGVPQLRADILQRLAIA